MNFTITEAVNFFMKIYFMLSAGAILNCVLLAHVLSAQVLCPKETACRKSEDRVNQIAYRIIDKGLEKIEKGIGTIFK